MTFKEKSRIDVLERELRAVEIKLASLRDSGGANESTIGKLEARRAELAALLAGQRPGDADVVVRTEREDPITGADLKDPGTDDAIRQGRRHAR